MHITTKAPLVVLGLTLLAGSSPAQQILPFPPTPSASKAGRTMQESTYAQRVEPR